MHTPILQIYKYANQEQLTENTLQEVEEQLFIQNYLLTLIPNEKRHQESQDF